MDSLPPSEEQKDRPLTFVGAAIWTLVAVFLYLLFAGMTDGGREEVDLVARTGCQALSYSIVFFGILRMHEPDTSIRHVLALRAPSVVGILLALLIGAALAVPSEFVDQLLDARFPRPPAEKETYDKIFAVATMGKRITLIATLVVLQPAFDELFFRGAIFTPLRRTRRAETVIVAVAAFETLGNFSPRAMIELLVVTLILSWIRGATGSIFPSMLARIAYDGVQVVPIALGRAELKPTKMLLAGSAIAVILGLLGLSMLSKRDARLLDARLEDGES